jgi:hypothetical protein
MFAFVADIGHWYCVWPNILNSICLGGLDIEAVHYEGFHSIVNQKISYGCEQEGQDLI